MKYMGDFCIQRRIISKNIHCIFLLKKKKYKKKKKKKVAA